MSPSSLTHIIRNCHISAAATPANALICLLGLWGHFSASALLTWTAATLLATLFVYRRTRAALDRPAPKRISRKAKIRTYLFAAGYASPWAALPLLFLGSDAPVTDAFILVVCAGNCAGGAFLLQRAPIAALCHFGTILLAVAIACVAHDPLQYGLLALYTLPFGAVMFSISLSGNRIAQENDQSLRSAASALEKLHAANAELDQLRSAAEREAERDELTGLLNRRGLNRALERRELDQPSGRGLAVLQIDLDGFKQINDALGHDAGDQLLCHVATRLRDACRNPDIIARTGGDEFVVIVDHVQNESALPAIAMRILRHLREPLAIEGGTQRCSASIGVNYQAPDQHGQLSFEEMLKNADTALYQAKDRGKDTFFVFETAPSETAEGEPQSEGDTSSRRLQLIDR